MALGDDFKLFARRVKNPYEKSGTAKVIVERLATWPLTGLLQKTFYDLPQKNGTNR
jgi:hypothetical protein